MRIMGIIKSPLNSMKPKISVLVAAVVAAGFFAVTAAHATIVDLTAGPDASGEIDGALFFASEQQPFGTGHVDPFLRIDQKAPTEQGYNTDGGFPFDDKQPHNFQHSLYIPDLTATIINGVPYLAFELDSNQAGNDYTMHEIDMTALQIFTTNDPNQTTESFTAGGILALNGTLVYNLDANGDNTVKMIAQGSGKADMIMYIPVSLVQTGELYLVLYSAFSQSLTTTGGFEEWIFIPGTVPIPETETLFPIVGLLAAMLSTRVLRRRKVAQLARQQVFLR
jgi:hypothetical protein